MPAPGYRCDPAITPTTPCVYLSSCGPGTGQASAISVSVSEYSRGPVGGVDTSGAPSGSSARPMSTSSTRPHCGAASRCACRLTPNVTVTSARTAGWLTSPVSASTPEGRSTATIGVSGSTDANTVAAAGRSGPCPPIPTTPSTTTSSELGSGSTTRPPARRNAANPPACALSGASSVALTAAPRLASSAPA